jgi:hypothetical protein
MMVVLVRLEIRAHDVIGFYLVRGCMQVRTVPHDGANGVKLVSCAFCSSRFNSVMTYLTFPFGAYSTCTPK